MKSHIILSLVAIAYCMCSAATPQKKLIHFGWAEPKSIAQLNHAIDELDKDCPVDGIGIRPAFILERNGRKITYRIDRAKGAPERLTKDDFKDWIPAFRRLRQTKLKHNFILTGSVLFNTDWFDDDAWSRTLNNFGMLAWLAKESGFKGIALDIEPYAHSGCPLLYRPELGHSFKNTQIQVCKRAAQWTKCINDNFPGITLFTFFWTSQCDSEYEAANPQAQYSSSTGLQTAFFNGVYDAAPLSMKIIDGHESAGYNAVTRKDYLKLKALYMKYAKAWIAPQNHAKFDAITQLSIALYLDSYVPKKTLGSWRHYSYTENPTNLLYENIANGMEFSDEYAWIWAERGTFWPKVTKSRDCPYWNDVLPFAKQAIEAGKDTARAMEKHAGKNILLNSNLEERGALGKLGPDQEELQLKNWAKWQNPDRPKGKITAEDGIVRFIDCQDANISQIIKAVKPGQRYILTGKAKQTGTSQIPCIGSFFRNSKRTGLWELNQSAMFSEGTDGWLHASLYIAIPDGYDIQTMTITAGVKGGGPTQPGDTGVIFDDIELKQISFPWEE